MLLASNEFDNRGEIPVGFTCDGRDLSPELHWSGAPEGTRSFVVLCDDPDAPAGTWRHWAAYDLAPGLTGLPRGVGTSSAPALRQAINDFGRRGYGGPCPPRNGGPHRYLFRLLAVSLANLALHPDARCRDVEREALKHKIDEAVLVGTFER